MRLFYETRRAKGQKSCQFHRFYHETAAGRVLAAILPLFCGRTTLMQSFFFGMYGNLHSLRNPLSQEPCLLISPAYSPYGRVGSLLPLFHHTAFGHLHKAQPYRVGHHRKHAHQHSLYLHLETMVQTSQMLRSSEVRARRLRRVRNGIRGKTMRPRNIQHATSRLLQIAAFNNLTKC